MNLGATRIAGAAACLIVGFGVAASSSDARAADTSVYVADNASGSVTPIAVATNHPSAPIAVGDQPFWVAVTPDGSTAYVTNSGDDSVTPIDLATGTTDAAIPVGHHPAFIAISPNGLTAYVTDNADTTVTPIDLATNTARSAIQVGPDPSAIAITPDGSTAYVSHLATDSVTPVNLATGTTRAPIRVGDSPVGIAITPDGETAYVADSGSDTVTPINLATGTPKPPIPVGVTPADIAIGPAGTTAYVTNAGSDTVTPINVATDTAGPSIPAGHGPYGIAITPNGATAYVADYLADEVTPIDLATGTARPPIPVGDRPEGVAITPAGPPSATIAQPTSGAVYMAGQHVATRFSCTDAPDGPGIRRCVDSNGAIGGSGTLRTAAVGSYVYSVTATSLDGQTATRSIHYTVTPKPPLLPTASIHIIPGTAGPTYHLSGAASTAAAGHHLTHYAWTSAGQPIGIGRAITHTFDAAGQPYPIMLTVIDDQGQTASATTTLTPHLKTAHASAVVHFARNRAALTAAARPMLRPLRAQATYAKVMTLTGYCAAREVNRHRLLLKLSRQRAQTVRTYLFSGDRRRRHNVIIRGEGATHFIAPNTTAAGRTRNRRTTIRITYSKPIRSR